MASEKNLTFYDQIEKNFNVKLRPNQRFYTFLICVFIATVLWFLKAFSKEYVTTIPFPVKYVNLPSDKVILNKLPDLIEVKVNAFGFDLLSPQESSTSDTLTIDGSAFQLRQIGDREIGYFSAQKLRSSLSNQLKSAVKVNEVLTDSIVLLLENRITRTVPIRLNMDISPAKQFLVDGDPKLNPPKVKVSGPGSVMDTLTHIDTEYKVLEDVHESQNLTALLSPPKGINTLTLVPNKVEVSIPVDQLTEGKLEIPITVLDVPDSLVVKTFPNTISLTYQVALNRYESVQVADFEASVSFQDIADHAPSVRVKVSNSPSYVNVVKHSPEKVEYIIRKQ